MVAGAAAGVAAIFKAPITGTVFALEVPFRDDTARRMLVPASVASAAGYVVFASINGTAPLFPTEESPALGWRELGGGLVVGLLCGLAARLFTVVIRKAKQLQARLDPPVRIGAAGALLAAIFAAGHLLTGESLTLGPGYNVVEWLDGSPSVGLVAAVLVLRTVATAATLAGGGAGGVFIPLVLFGMLTGHVVGGAIDGTAATLFPLVGVAAFLGAGYRTPLAAVVFVAESTGQAGFVVPALLAAAVSQLVMGRASVSPYQETGELGHVERRLQLPLAAALRPDVPTASPHLSLQELLGQHLVSARNQGVAVATDGRYLGIVRWEDVHQVPPDQWTTTTLADILRTDLEVASPDWQLEQAVEAMHAAHLDMLPVVTDRRELVGVVTLDDVVRLEDLLPDTTTGPA
jgi:CIC family chloride channel protein